MILFLSHHNNIKNRQTSEAFGHTLFIAAAAAPAHDSTAPLSSGPNCSSLLTPLSAAFSPIYRRKWDAELFGCCACKRGMCYRVDSEPAFPLIRWLDGGMFNIFGDCRRRQGVHSRGDSENQWLSPAKPSVVEFLRE